MVYQTISMWDTLICLDLINITSDFNMFNDSLLTTRQVEHMTYSKMFLFGADECKLQSHVPYGVN